MPLAASKQAGKQANITRCSLPVRIFFRSKKSDGDGVGSVLQFCLFVAFTVLLLQVQRRQQQSQQQQWQRQRLQRGQVLPAINLNLNGAPACVAKTVLGVCCSLLATCRLPHAACRLPLVRLGIGFLSMPSSLFPMLICSSSRQICCRTS